MSPTSQTVVRYSKKQPPRRLA